MLKVRDQNRAVGRRRVGPKVKEPTDALHKGAGRGWRWGRSYDAIACAGKDAKNESHGQHANTKQVEGGAPTDGGHELSDQEETDDAGQGP